MALKAEFVGIHEAADIIDRVIRLRDPEGHALALAEANERRLETLRENEVKTLAKVEIERGKRPTVKEIAAIRRKMHAESSVIDKLTWRHYWLNGKSYPLTRFGLTGINRELAGARIDLYSEEMVAGRWHFSPDPIVITEEGYIVNGQHRLIAAASVTWEEGDVIPQFLVVWGVDKRTALLMDEAARSTKDRRHIAFGYADALNGGTPARQTANA